ncbi:hypothetical protein BHE90_003570 [Fusarium euwallaceae]|uniref:Uncharacterized protein n=1 Tax=Fusarium euwallaceae TaxID=1147111 RepID=A0A430M1M9_9HYPO|nr:hypothetical protein BHE90_003570 [Fusarium euwallaceae]
MEPSNRSLFMKYKKQNPIAKLKCISRPHRRIGTEPVNTIAPNRNANDPQILRRPGFHRAVGKIHKTINEKQYGRNPHEPLAPGEATADPNSNDRHQRFAKHFIDELKNQFRGKPTELPSERPKK